MHGIMRGRVFIPVLVLVGAGLLVPSRAGAQTPEAPALSGWIHFGLRSLSVAGSPLKYDEDHNLQSGMRLLGLALRGRLAEHDMGVDAGG